MFSILEMFKIGVGPSSSHTVGPMVAACKFVESLEHAGTLGRVSRVRTVLYGSLALTGLGHGTDRATVAGLEGNMPQTVDTDHVNIIRHECESSGELLLAGIMRIDFDYAHDVVMDVWHRLAAHPNGMRFQAFDQQNNLVDEQVWYSIGGGFVRQGNAEDLMIGIHECPPVGNSFADQQSDPPTDAGSMRHIHSRHATNSLHYARTINTGNIRRHLCGPTKRPCSRRCRFAVNWITCGG